MHIPQLFPCIYCKNPRPDITLSRTSTSGYSISSPTTKILPAASVTGNEEVEVHKPPKVNCEFCKKQYYLLATQNDDGDFFNFTFSKLKMHNSLLDIMKKEDLLVEDIENGYIGITRPLVSFYKLTEKNQCHVVFEVGKKVYYLVCRRNNTGHLIATGLEVVD